MVQRDVAAAKVARASAWIDYAGAILARPQETFLADAQGRDLATFYVFLSIQECIDLAAHWVAAAGWPPPGDAASTFDVLADRSAIDSPLADAMRAAVGLRNRIAHGYAGVDHRRVYTESRDGLPALRRFLAAVTDAARI